MLVATGRLQMIVSPLVWWERLLATPGVALADFSPRLLFSSSFLPGTPPRDPADRILVATAREEGFVVVPRDRSILDYAAEGHVAAIAF